jgi:hypothetical protein
MIIILVARACQGRAPFDKLRVPLRAGQDTKWDTIWSRICHETRLSFGSFSGVLAPGAHSQETIT